MLATLIVTDGAAGNTRQAAALAGALGLVARTVAISLPRPWRWFAPRGALGAELAMPSAVRAFAEMPSHVPRLVIGCGRAAALATRWLRAHGVIAVQVLDPRIAARHWDLVIVPAHDRLRGDNVHVTTGSLHPVTRELLDASALPSVQARPAPRVLVAIGGSNRAQAIDGAYVGSLVRELARWPASFLITTSRRTSAEATMALREFAQRVGALLYVAGEDPAAPNPYLAFLAAADAIVVSPDSVNLATEACATDRPVYVHANAPITGKHGAFHARLAALGRTRALVARDEAWKPAPLDDMPEVVQRVRELLVSRGALAPTDQPRPDQPRAE